ncbi:MAG: nitrite reductase (NAD(P)H) small subunit, partial [Rheinheimera sp.]
MRLIDICSLDDLVENSGVGVLVGDLQVAIFWDKHPESGELGEIYAIDNYDPIGGANLL